MFDPLSSTFGEEPPPPWPTTPHTPNTPIPNLPRPSSTRPVTPVTPDRSLNTGLYGKEPKIYGAPEPGLISPQTTTSSNGTRFEKPEPYVRVRITGLDRNRRDILVKFDAQTNLSNFTGSTYRNVSRSYVEFQQFYDAIVHTTPQTIVPALPLPQTSAPTDEEDDRLVRIMLQRWLSRVCEDPILMQEEEVRSFIESDFGYQPTPTTRRKTSSGFSLIRRGVPDEDEELQRARFELTKLEGQFFDAAKAIDKLSKARKTLGAVRAEMGNKLVNVATTEAHPPLGNAMRKIGRAWHSISDLEQAQGISECVIIGDSLGYQGLNARSAKETLLQRTAVLEEYQAAVKTTISKRRNIERLKASSNIRGDRVDEAIEDMEEANRYEQILARRADGISQNLHRALDRHNRLVADDVTAALIEHTRSSIMYERQLLRELEALRPDISNAAKKHVPAKPLNGAPRPTVVPPLEDFSRPAIQRPASAVNPIPPGIPSPLPAFNPPLSARPFGSSATISASSSRSVMLPQSPGAGPSMSSGSGSQSSFTSPLSGPSEPPLGGRLVDNTKSTLAKSSQPPLGGPLSASSSTVPNTPTSPPKATFQSPLHAPHPLAQSMSTSASERPSGGLDPLGMAQPAFMSSSVRVAPTRPRLDAREAASKLANMF